MPEPCRGCGATLAYADRTAVIVGRVMGDEVGDVYYRCPKCGEYSIDSFRDSFTTGDHSSWKGPYHHEQVAEKLAQIARCKDPSNERCRCQAHRDYFGAALD